MSIGIDKLVDSFMGNPAPLQAKVDRDNAGKPPNAIPKDLEEAIALQEIADVHMGAQNDQAMQAGGPQPSVVQKLQQMLASAEQRQQAQMPQGTPPQMPPQMPKGMPPQMPRGMPPQMPKGMPPQMPQGMPPKPVMAARGGSISQLMSNLGRNYDGGGIVAFAPGGEIKLGTDFAAFLEKMGSDYVTYANSPPEVQASMKEMYRDFKATAPAAGEVANVASKAAPAAAEGRGLMYGAGKLAGKAVKGAGIPGALASAVSEFGDYKLKSDDDIDTSASGTIDDLKKGELRRAAKGLGMGLGELGADLGSSVANTLDYVVPGKAPVSSAYDKLLRDSGLFKDKASAPTKEEATAGDAETEKLKRSAAARAQTGQNTNPALRPKPPAAVVKPSGPPGPPKPVVTKPEVEAPEPVNKLRAAIEANIFKDLGKDEDAEWQKGAKRHKDFMGIDKLLEPKNARIAEREGMQRKIQGQRLPEWVAGFDRASKPIVSGGLGTMLNNLGSGMQGQREAYSGEDLKFFDEISAMKDEVLKLTVEGNYKAAAAGEAAIKDAIANKRQAEQSGTSLLNTDEQTATRKQIAKDNLAARLANAGSGASSKNMANAINAVKSDEVINRLQKDADALAKSFLPRDKAKLAEVMRQIETRQNAIYKEFGVLGGLSTMAAAPGAASPGGTKPGWGKASTV
jgi:hypothetical protein